MNAISSCLEDFIELLQREVETYCSMVPLLKEENKALSTADLEGLKANNRRLETLFMEIRILEEARRGMVENLAGELNVDAGELTLLRLSKAMKEPVSTRLLDCRNAFNELLDPIGKLVNRNASLIEYSFGANNNLIAFLGSCLSEEHTYNDSGMLIGKTDKKLGMLTWKA